MNKFILTKDTQVYKNDIYIVSVKRLARNENFSEFPPIVHVTIVRIDRQKILEWSELQKIKDTLVGEEYTAIQIFPSKKNVVDNSHAYHLWVFDDPSFQFPFGLDVDKFKHIKGLKDEK